jgi:MFS family permease
MVTPSVDGSGPSGSASADLTGMATRSQRRRVVAASTVGTTIEWYDFFLYGTEAALIFPALFFPKQAAFTGILLSFGTPFVGFAAQSLGAAIFGHFGDRHGRRTTLVTTLMLMGIATFLIGVLSPTVRSVMQHRSCSPCRGWCRASASAASGAARC